YPVDIAIFSEDKPHKQENIYIIVETKSEAVKPTSKEDGIGQLSSYVGASLNCEFGMWTNGTDKFCFQKKRTNGQYEISEVVDIPPRGKSLEEYEELDFKQLRPATELESVFRRCHDYIYGNQGLPKDAAFHELLKVIFCKVHDEKESARIRFYVANRELKNPIGQIKVKERLEEIFSEVKERYPHIFKPDQKIELLPRVLAYIVGQLQHFSLILTETDVKGEAYEAIVGANLRGDRGEFFTPRNVCKMAVESLFSMYPPERWNSLRIIDPACGTGGFLIEVINFLKRHFIDEERRKYKDETQALKQAEDRLKKYCEQFLYGIDINPLLVRASQMNEVMHGNGSGNLFAEDSLLQIGEWKDETKRDLLESFDLVFTNPPFGSKIPIDDPHTLAQYDLAYIWNKEFERRDKLQKSVPPEQLFIERCLQFLKPKGKLAIVLPDSILSNPGLAYIRYWILRKAKIIASIDLSREAFQPYVGTKTSVLFLEKKPKDEILVEERTGKLQPYDVYMAMVEKVGHDRRGNTLFKRTPEGEEVIVEKEKEIVGLLGKERYIEKRKVMEPIVDDDLPSVTSAFKNWLGNK
ncbi:N-6 DNA methylase, partial [Candidatus Bathyarchaeota archaeon]|nr:N-6 DNA methylase [Candidatus Bathyarchaeota archaeon]